MALKKLPQDVQSILSASAQINSFKKTVEELLYNAVDADSTSIAIRLHIQNSTIQVIDNGNGIQKHDFKALGQKHMTSKITDLSTLRSAPQSYGYRGESLSNIVTVSQTVKIISRHKDEAEDTWVKIFYNGKEKRMIETSKRPSKGTTVEITGFLYNHNIQKKAVDSLNELQNIKQFLEHLSLVHNDISLSLRDDSKNEIIFKIHKKRDIYQTLTSLFDIKENEIQELLVEKNNYRVRGLIGKTDKECYLYWIYINGKFIYNNSKVHKMVKDNFNKSLLTKNKNQGGLKSKNHIDEKHLFKNNLPCYFIFITCPYIDYVISDTPNHPVLEFKNWEQIKNLLQKLVKFYVGDIVLKEIREPNIQVPIRNQDNIIVEDTRDQVKKIMDNILGCDPKKFGVSQLQKGIKGKLIKRNAKKKIMKKTPSKRPKKLFIKNDRSIINNVDVPPSTSRTTTGIKNCDDAKTKKKSKIKKKATKFTVDPKENNVKKKKTRNKSHCIPKSIEDEEYDVPNLNMNNNIPKDVPKHFIAKESFIKSGTYKLNDCKKLTKNVFKKFEKDIDSVEKQSRIVAEKAEKFLKNNIHNARCKRQPHKINHSLGANKGIVPFPPKINQNMIDKHIWIKMREITFKTTYDLVQTILKSQKEFVYTEKENNSDIYTPCQHNNNYYSKLTSNYFSNAGLESKLTYESHCYSKKQDLQKNIGTEYNLNQKNSMRFITKLSRDNFTVPNEKFKSKLQNKFKQRRKVYDGNRMYDVCLKQTIEESMYTIECSKTSSNTNDPGNRIHTPLNQTINYTIPNYTQINYYDGNHENIPIGGSTYTISPSDFPYNKKHNTQHPSPAQKTNREVPNNDNVIISDSTNKVEETYFDCIEYNNDASCMPKAKDRDNNINYEKNLNIIFLSKSQSSNTELNDTRDVDPLNICEIILGSPIIDEKILGNNINSRNKLNDSLFQNLINVQNSPYESVNFNIIENVSHHFSNNNQLHFGERTLQSAGDNIVNEERLDAALMDQEQNKLIKIDATYQLDDHMISNNDFNFKNRLRFVPKGMSQIFAICNTKTACDYNLDSDYFEDSIYNNFANDVQVNIETYESIVQNIKDYTTANIQKANDKLNKANASLIFDGISLKEAKVLGQIDCKFIAAVMRQKSHTSEDLEEYLVLFDQHAVHERIRLERNIADYLSVDQWKSVPLGNIALNLSKDEVLYLHNYEDKFNQLGLQWTILGDSLISINAIPEAILGKNLREVENIIKAVKKLIKEQITIIKTQKGCVSLYPKSIMDLVFSEACRYAIKFGDRLSNTNCRELLQALSICKTPFQCAHGRPVMAVLMDIRSVKREYKVDVQNIKHFILKRKQ